MQVYAGSCRFMQVNYTYIHTQRTPHTLLRPIHSNTTCRHTSPVTYTLKPSTYTLEGTTTTQYTYTNTQQPEWWTLIGGNRMATYNILNDGTWLVRTKWKNSKAMHLWHNRTFPAAKFPHSLFPLELKSLTLVYLRGSPQCCFPFPHQISESPLHSSVFSPVHINTLISVTFSSIIVEQI
jgi:hypothetical protein